MFRRNLPPELIERLKPAPSWQNICQDSELWPEIRNNAITVYYRGGALLKELRLMNGDLVADVHPKFIPLQQTATKYIRLVEKGAAGLSFAEPLGPLPLTTADPQTLRAYKAMMDQVLTTFPEGEIVQSICCRSENQILDQDFFPKTQFSRTSSLTLSNFF